MRYLEFASGIHGEAPERLMVCLDVSPSMEETDWPPSRLDAAVEATAALIERKRTTAPQDEVGIVTYSGDASVCSEPLEAGRHTARLIDDLRGIRTGSGTNITAALKKARPMLIPPQRILLNRFRPPHNPAAGRVCRVILLTDGGHNEGPNPESVAQELKRAGVCIDCVGIGGDPSAVREDLLKQIASTHKDEVTPRYVFIGDKRGLIRKFEQLAGRITR